MDDPREAKRLAVKVDADAWVDKYLRPLVNNLQYVLDIGCGPGAIATAVAALQNGIRVTGIDLSADRIAVRNVPSNVKLQVADAHHLPFPDCSFDLTYCRMLMEYLPEKQKAVNEMVRVCRPGGLVLLQDLDGQLVWHFPEDSELETQVTRILVGLAMSGFDPFVGRKLYAFAKAAGLTEMAVSAESYHLFAGKIDDFNYRLWEMKLDIAMPAAVKILGGQAAAQLLKERFLGYLRRDDTLTYSVVFTVVGKKRDPCAE
jgi:ubiquinone/menaquinone biosynthesis C-methylase UbiE